MHVHVRGESSGQSSAVEHVCGPVASKYRQVSKSEQRPMTVDVMPQFWARTAAANKRRTHAHIGASLVFEWERGRMCLARVNSAARGRDRKERI